VCSVNLITSSSNSGKTRFLKEIVIHRDRFFQTPQLIRRVVYINANGRDPSFRHPWIPDSSTADTEEEDLSNNTTEGLEVVSLALQDFIDPAATLNELDIVIFDDLLHISESVDFCLKYAAHHFRLFVFLVTQSCLSSPLYRLVQSAHNVVLLFGNTGCTRLAQHLIQTFFFCSDTKAYLKAILAIAERQQDAVLLKLNSVASYRLHSHVLALTRVQGLFEEDPPYCFLYPELGHSDHLISSAMNTKTSNETSESSLYVAELPQVRGQFLEEAFLLVPASRVRQEANNPEAQPDPDDLDLEGLDLNDEGTGKDCLKEKQRQWIKLNAFLKREIEETFPVRRWVPARNLTRELLRSKELCVTPDHRTIFVRARPKWRYSIIDFLNLATRKAGPAELQSDKVQAYVPLVQILLKNNVPETFFINRVLLAAAQLDPTSTRGRRGRRRRRQSNRSRNRFPKAIRGRQSRPHHHQKTSRYAPPPPPSQWHPTRPPPSPAPLPWNAWSHLGGRGGQNGPWNYNGSGGFGYGGVHPDLYHV